MAFENLQDKLQNIFKKLRGRGRLSENDINISMREVKNALLEADVALTVVNRFIGSVSERALGSEVLESLTPGQQIVKIVNDELTALMGNENVKINTATKPPTIIMLIGLQGAGKTTNGAKLAGYFKTKFNKRPLLVACDIYRPAAIEQLKIVGAQVGVPVFEQGQTDPVQIAKQSILHARDHGNDMVFIDTAGRLHIDDELMNELNDIKLAVQPNEIMLVVDAMTGQDAVNAATAFNLRLGIDSVFLAKLDSDTRGGAALSVRAATGRPIKFVGIGEKLDSANIEPFYPDRMASRILGMGDMLTLIEKAQESFDERKAVELEEKMRKNQMTLDDFLDQMRQLTKMGSIQSILGMVPGLDTKQLQNAKIDERQIARTEAIILSMTKKERQNPEILNYSRKKRISAGSGTRIEDINRLLKQFDMTCKMARKMSGGKTIKNFGGPQARNSKGFKYPFR